MLSTTATHDYRASKLDALFIPANPIRDMEAEAESIAAGEAIKLHARPGDRFRLTQPKRWGSYNIKPGAEAYVIQKIHGCRYALHLLINPERGVALGAINSKGEFAYTVHHFRSDEWERIS